MLVYHQFLLTEVNYENYTYYCSKYRRRWSH